MGAIGAVSSLAQLRPNRLAAGLGEPLQAAGPFAIGVVLALVVAGAAALLPEGRWRRVASLLAAPLLLIATAWAVGGASVRLLAGQPATARVSLGAGAWVLLASVAVLGLASRQLRPPTHALRRVLLLLGAAGALAALPLGGLSSLSLAREFSARADTFWPLVQGHVTLAAASLAAGTAIGVPLGMWAARSRRARGTILGITGAIQTIPSLALLGLLVVPLAALGAAVPLLGSLGVRGIGAFPGFIALTLYALLPVVRGTYVGLSHVEPAAVDAGRGMGMSRGQLLARVELPLAVPLVVDGIRTAAVLDIGITTLTAFAGARNLGVMIIDGLGQFAPDLILLGALPIIVLAIAADASFGWLARALTPKGVRA